MLWRTTQHSPTAQLLHSISHCLSTAAVDLPVPPAPQVNRVVVSGLGLACPLGVGVEQCWQALAAGQTAVRGLLPSDLPEDQIEAYDQLPSKVIATVPQQALLSSPHRTDADQRRHAKGTLFALIAATETLHDGEWLPCSASSKQRTGVAIGGGMSSTADIAEAGALVVEGKLRRLTPYFIPKVLLNMPAGMVSITYHLQGPCHSAATACAAGAHSIADAYRIVQRGEADVMVAGGTESCIDAVSLGGFSRLRALSTAFNNTPERASRPFDAQRDGFVMGEGAGILLLENLEHALVRGAPIYAEVLGVGMSADGYHMTQPPADGSGAILAMQRALTSAGLQPQHVHYLNAHATSTPIGDDVEQTAIATVFGDHATKPGGLVVSSTKGATGHLLGAAGAVESIFTVLAVSKRQAPPTVNLEQQEPEILADIAKGRATKPLPADGRVVAINNSFGFGGTNISVVFASPP